MQALHQCHIARKYLEAQKVDLQVCSIAGAIVKSFLNATLWYSWFGLVPDTVA
jgi:hypothetical protein